jgi:hypothetical protein
MKKYIYELIFKIIEIVSRPIVWVSVKINKKRGGWL